MLGEPRRRFVEHLGHGTGTALHHRRGGAGDIGTDQDGLGEFGAGVHPGGAGQRGRRELRPQDADPAQRQALISGNR